MGFEEWLAAKHAGHHADLAHSVHHDQVLGHEYSDHHSRHTKERLVHEDVYFDSDDEGHEDQRTLIDGHRVAHHAHEQDRRRSRPIHQ